MPKTKLSRAKMCKEILVAIQEYPDCKDVKEVSIVEVADTAAESIWRVTVVDTGGVDIEKANHAARNVQKSFVNNMGCRHRGRQFADTGVMSNPPHAVRVWLRHVFPL